MWSVRFLSGPQTGQIFDLKLGKNLFGRGGNCDLKIQSLGISKEHCEIHVYKDKMMIVDLKSSNGTFVNGVKIQNSLIRIGDKISLFDIILDLIPTPDLRPKNNVKVSDKAMLPAVKEEVSSVSKISSVPQVASAQIPQMQMPMATMPQSQHGNLALQQQGYSSVANLPNMMYAQQSALSVAPPSTEELPAQAAAMANKSLQQKWEEFLDNKVMPAIYKLTVVFSFKQVLMGFVILFILGVTLLSLIPMTTILKEGNLIEAKKRARSIARAIARINEQALLANQFSSLTVQEALKEEGVRAAYIIQHSDGVIVAPSEKAGRDAKNSFILKARQESRATVGDAGSGLIGASYPIGVYDPSTGEPSVKFHAIAIYDVSSLNLDEERVISLFMQTLIISSILGLILYYLFARLIEYPVRSLNEQIDKALIEKSDRTEVLFNYESFQKLVSNVNTLLNRVWSGGDQAQSGSGIQQNREIEFSNLVDMISHPAIIVDSSQRVVAINSNFEQLAQVAKESLINQSYQNITDSALVQNIDSLIAKSQASPYEKYADKIPFAQFECHIYCQAFFDAQNQPEYFVLTLVQATEGG